MVELREPGPRDSWLTTAVVFACAAAMLAAALLSPRIGVAGVFAVAAGVVALLAWWMSRAWGYRCPACGAEFRLSVPGQFTALNMGHERNIRCPRCCKRSWMKTLRRA